MLVMVFILAAVTDYTGARHIPLNNFGYYWRDWNVNDPIPKDAVSGGVEDGKETFITRNIYPKVGQIVVGKAVPCDKASYFEFSNEEHKSEEDVQVLCAINHKRLIWVNANDNQGAKDVAGDNMIIVGGHDRSRPLAIGRKIDDHGIIHIGKILIDDDKFITMRVCKNGKGWGVTDYQMLVYDYKRDFTISLDVDEN